jgi:hypothetical protein
MIILFSFYFYLLFCTKVMRMKHLRNQEDAYTSEHYEAHCMYATMQEIVLKEKIQKLKHCYELIKTIRLPKPHSFNPSGGMNSCSQIRVSHNNYPNICEALFGAHAIRRLGVLHMSLCQPLHSSKSSSVLPTPSIPECN